VFEQTIAPMDTCGCGDIGYLTTRTIPVDLAHGVGHIANVPVYHCRSKSCFEFTLPQLVSRRIEEIAEQMEIDHATKAVYSWNLSEEKSNNTNQSNFKKLQLEAFTLQFVDREYEDATVVLVIPGQAVFFKSTIEDSEYFLLQYQPEYNSNEIWFDFLKFYYEKPKLTYENFLAWSETGYIKELGNIALPEVEATLLDEFGDWT